MTNRWERLTKSKLPMALTVGLQAVALGVIQPAAIAQSVSFSDVHSSFWATPCITELAQRQIIKGYPDGLFRPFNPVTRAEFAAMLRQAFPNQAFVRNAIQFTDVPANHWAIAAIQDSYRKGFLSGYPGQQFQPNQYIPRVQAVVALASGLNYTTSEPTAQVLSSAYTDSEDIPDYGRNSVAAATTKGLVVNYPEVQLFDPNRVASRTEVATFLCQALQPGLVSEEYIAKPQQS